jgi:hypothetical protein
MDDQRNTSAKTLIIEAAEKSGLLKEVAQLLWFSSISNNYGAPDTRAVAELRSQLTDIMARHVVVPGLVAQQIYDKAVDIHPMPEDAHEVDAFM